MQSIATAWAWVTAHWGTVVGVLYGVSAILSSLITAFTAHPAVETWLHRIQGALSWVEHQNVGGWKWPFAALTAPVKGQPVPIKSVPPVSVLLLALSVALLVAGPARAAAGGTLQLSAPTFTFGTPVLSWGPGLALTIDWPNQPNPAHIAQGAGLMGCLGEGQFALGGKSWDLLDLCANVIGSFNDPVGGLIGALTLGTMNNLVGFGAATPITRSSANPPPGTIGFVIMLNFPIDLGGPASPPVGIAPGAKALPRGGTLSLP